MGKFAVIDTETNWADQVMSIGTVIADADSFLPIEAKYHILPIECEVGGMYYDTLFLKTPVKPILCTRAEAIADLRSWFRKHSITSIFAYNACFDRNHLPELRDFDWYDIMRLAAYRQHNPKIPANADCCSTGRLKRGYGVEPMLRLLSGNRTYRESHNAFFDAMDELEIMRLLQISVKQANASESLHSRHTSECGDPNHQIRLSGGVAERSGSSLFIATQFTRGAASIWSPLVV